MLNHKRPGKARRPTKAVWVAGVTGVLGLLAAIPVHGQQSGIRGTFDTRDSILPIRVPAQQSTNRSSDGSQPVPQPRYEPVTSADGGTDDPTSIFDLNGARPGATDDVGAGASTTLSPSGPSLRELRARREARSGSVAERSEDDRSERLSPTRDAALQTDPDTLETGTIRVGAVDAVTDDDDRSGLISAENTAIEGRDVTPEDDPFAPLGIRAGLFTLFPVVEQGIDVEVDDGETTVSSSTTLSLEARSDRASGSDTITGFVTYIHPFEGDDAEDFEFGGTISSATDFAGGWRGTFDAAVDRQRESASTPVSLAGFPDRPYRTLITGTLGLEKTVGKARGRLALSIDRADYEDATLSTGTTFDQTDRNNTLILAALRAGYEVSPAYIPFVEVEGGRRLYDLDFDRNGLAREATRLSLRAGTEFDFGEKLNGELSAGWLREDFEDSTLSAVSGLRLDALVNWSPVRETNVRLALGTFVEGTTDPGSSGSVLYNADIDVSRQVFANLNLNAGLGIGYRDFSDSGAYDVIYSAEAGATWWMNRMLGVNARARYERTTSSDAGRENDELTIFAGVRARR